MKVKTQGLLNAGRYIEAEFGKAALERLLKASSPPVRATYAASIGINWHPLEELCEFVELAEKQLGAGDYSLTQAIGAAGARANLKGVLLKIALYLGKPSFLMKRITGMWHQYNDEGTIDVLEMTPTRASVELRGMKRPNATLCHILTGWVAEITVALGALNVTASHIECRARGQARCVWEVRGKLP